METAVDIAEYQPKKQPNFPQSESVGERPWGTETLLCLVPGKFMLKELIVKAGSKGGLQFHRKKDECGILLEGIMIIRHENAEGQIVERKITAGDTFHFPPGIIHQEEALTDCKIIEASSPHFNDRVRMEAFFGIDNRDGLPSTSASEIDER
jgi:mannose-6-phosphate isomerase